MLALLVKYTNNYFFTNLQLKTVETFWFTGINYVKNVTHAVSTEICSKFVFPNVHKYKIKCINSTEIFLRNTINADNTT